MPWKYLHNNSSLKNIILHLWIQQKKKKKLPAKSSEGFQTADTPTGGSNCISAVSACFPSDLPSSSKLSATFCQAKQKLQKQNSRCKSGCNTYSIGLSDQNCISLQHTTRTERLVQAEVKTASFWKLMEMNQRLDKAFHYKMKLWF